eukprot:RCo029411
MSGAASTVAKPVEQVVKAVASRIEVFIDSKPVSVEPNWTIHEACRQNGVFVPTVCHHPRLKPAGKCRVCAVHVNEGQTSMYKLACCSKVTPQMQITTNSLTVKGKAELALKKVMSPLGKYGVVPVGLTEDLDRLNAWEKRSLVDESSTAIIRDNNLCVACTRCVRACSDQQGMNILETSMEDQGFQYATTHNGENLAETDCILCGQCAVFCPTGAIVEKDHIQDVLKAQKAEKIMILQSAPATRVAIAELFGAPPGTIATGKLVGAAHAAGFSHVFDTNFAADLTIMEEGTEFLKRLKNGGPFPMFTSCCPAWINLVEKRYPEFIPNLSTCRSPQMMMGSTIKSYWAQKLAINPEDIFSVSMMPCVAKKDEIDRSQLLKNGKRDVDAVLTTREFAKLLRMKGIKDWNSVKDTPYDDPLGRSTGAASLFGVTGGVMEAALRTAYETVTGKALPKLDFHACRGLDGIKEATIEVGGTNINICIASGGKNVHKVMDWIKNKQKTYHFVEMMACPSGCIGGGGQPRSDDPDVLNRRMESIYSLDSGTEIRKSHENQAVKELYANFLEWPGSPMAHRMLHTRYENRMKPVVPVAAHASHRKEHAAGSGVLVLFGSQGGTAAGAARQLKEQYERRKPGAKVRCMPMNSYNFADLPKETNVLMVCSTYGEGTFPDNATEFWDKLRDPNLPDGFLKNVKFSVCGLGSSAYALFNQAAKNLDRRFEELGATRLAPTVLAGERVTEKYMATFDPWAEGLMGALGSSGESINEPATPSYQLTLAFGSKRKLLRPCPPGYHFVHLDAKHRLTSPVNYPRPADFLDLNLKGSGMTYSAGGHLAILPRNNSGQVDRFLEFAGLEPQRLVSVHVVNGEASEIPPVLEVRELFEQYMDIGAPVTRKFLQQLALFAEPTDAKAIRELCANPKSPQFEEFLLEYTHEDALKMFPSAMPPIESLISMIPTIKARKYSIASSAQLHPDNAHLVVVQWSGALPSGKIRTGLCSKYLLSLNPVERPPVAAQVHEGILAAPEEGATPCMFIALGTGIASVRAFLQDREAMQRKGVPLGKCHLWFGVRHRQNDHFFKELFENYVRCGILTAVHTSFSHDDPQVFETVPMIMDKDPDAVWDVLKHPDACCYYCGPAMGIPKMCSDAMTRALVTAGKMTQLKAEEYFKTMVSEERWRMECF